MITKEQRFRLTIFLASSLVLLVIILAVFIIPKLSTDAVLYFVNFKGMSVNGVNEGADVKYQGVKIGNVERLEVNPNDLNSILIFVRVKKGFTVKQDMRAALQYQGITGLRFVEISGGRAESPDVEPKGEILPKKGMGEKAEDIVLNVDSVVQAVNEILNPESRKRIAQLFDNLEKSTHVISNVLQKREKNLGSAIENLDKIMAQMVVLSENLNKITAYMNQVTDSGRIDRLLRESENLIKTISKRFSDDELGKTMSKMNTVLDTADTGIKKIENRFFYLEGQISKMLASLRESVENLARFTRELNENPTILIRKRAAAKE